MHWLRPILGPGMSFNSQKWLWLTSCSYKKKNNPLSLASFQFYDAKGRAVLLLLYCTEINNFCQSTRGNQICYLLILFLIVSSSSSSSTFNSKIYEVMLLTFKSLNNLESRKISSKWTCSKSKSNFKNRLGKLQHWTMCFGLKRPRNNVITFEQECTKQPWCHFWQVSGCAGEGKIMKCIHLSSKQTSKEDHNCSRHWLSLKKAWFCLLHWCHNLCSTDCSPNLSRRRRMFKSGLKNEWMVKHTKSVVTNTQVYLYNYLRCLVIQ